MAAVQPSRVLAPQPLQPISATSPSAASSASSPPALSPTGPSLVAKEWIVPPRPKPGRKPATDTPPTKRKAQNRAAQRAFRERRAAKVGELQVQIDEMEREHDGVVGELHAQMAELEEKLDQRLRDAVDAYENDLRKMEQELTTWRIRSQDLEGLVLEERRKREAAERELASVRESVGDSGAVSSSESNVQVGSSKDQPIALEATDLAAGCGRCTTFTRCQCIEEALLEMPDESDEAQAQKRSSSPFVGTENTNKRLKHEDSTEDDQPLEIDFTNFNATPTTSIDDITTLTATAPPIEGCGFCQEGSACLCAELAADKARGNQARQISTMSQIDRSTAPTPSLPVSRMATKNQQQPPLPSSSSCTKDPGTCSKCRSDPTSTLLCKTLAAAQPPALRSISSVARSADPCPLGAACCRVSRTLDNLPTTHANHLQNISARMNGGGSSVGGREGGGGGGGGRGQVQAVTGPTISCADAFTTLSRHPAFERASKDIGEWLPRLVTIPSVSGAAAGGGRSSGGGDGGSGGTSSGEGAASARDNDDERVAEDVPEQQGLVNPLAGRTAFDIEAASVMGVLRMFDRRFGREG